jgi:hypothetical protein
LEALDSLMPALRRAQADVDAARVEETRRIRDAQAPLDTFRLGPATILTPAGREERARSVLGRVWREEYAGWADSDDAGTSPLWLTFQWSSDPVDIQAPGQPLVRVTGAAWRTRRYMEEGARTALGNALARQLQGTALAQWTDGAPVRSPPDGRRIYRVVATAASDASRACLAGDVDRCGVALSLDTDDTPFDEWYTAEQRRLLVLRQAPLFRYDEPEGASLDACLDGETASCDAILQAFRIRQLGGPETGGSHPYWGAPLPGWVRASFLWVALQEGDADTWARLREAADLTPVAALEHATGQPREELLARWQAWVVDQRPRKQNTAGANTLPALLWAALFFTFALRSTRWRLG